MAKAKKTALNISTGKDKSTKAQRKRAYTVAVLITVLVISVGLMVACDNATPSVSSVQGSSSVYNWKEKVANTDWNYEEGKDSFSGETNEFILALLDCNQVKIESDLKLTFTGGLYGNVTSLAPLVFDEISDGGGEQCNGSVRIAGMTFRFHFSKTETEKRVKLWLSSDENKYLRYKQVSNNK